MDTHLAQDVGEYFLASHPRTPLSDRAQQPGSLAITTACVAGIARRTGLPEHLVDDVVQESVMTTIVVIERLRARGEDVRSWYGVFRRVASWRALSVLRAIHFTEPQQDEHGRDRYDVEERIDVDELLLQRQILKVLRETFAGATNAQREAVTLYARTGFKTSKMDTGSLGKSRTAVATNMSAFRKRARKAVVEEVGPEALAIIA